MLSKMNKILPTFGESSSDGSLMIITVVSMDSMLSLRSRNNLYKKKN